MALVVVGNVDADRVVALCDEYLEKAEGVTVERAFEEEPREIVKPYDEYNLVMSMPVFHLVTRKNAKHQPVLTERLLKLQFFLKFLQANLLLFTVSYFSKGLSIQAFQRNTL